MKYSQLVIMLLLVIPIFAFSQNTTEVKIEQLLKSAANVIASNPDSAIIYANTAITYAKNNKSSKYTSKSYQKLGEVYRHNNQYEQALEAYQKAVVYAKKMNSEAEIIAIECLIARVFTAQSKFEEALSIQKKAYKYALEYNDTSLLANTSLDLGVIHARKGEYYIAIEYFFKSLAYNEAIGETKHTIAILNNIGSIYSEIEAYEKALTYLKKAKSKLIEEPEKRDLYIIALSTNIGRCYVNLNQYKSAIENYELALSEAERIDNLYYKSFANSQLGANYLEIGNIDKALQAYNKAYDYLKNENYPEEFAAILRGLAKVYQKKGAYNEALKYIEESSTINISINNLDDIMLDYEILSSIHHHLGHTQKAYDYLKQHLELKDSVYNIKKSAEIMLLESKYNYEEEQLQLNYELDELKKDKLVQEEQNKQERIVLYIAIFLVISISFGAFRFYRISKTKTELSIQLQHQAEELASLNKTKNRFFTNVSHELKTPLTLIINPIKKLLNRKDIDNEAYYLLNTIKKHSFQLLDLTNQVLELTKFDTNKAEVNITAINLHQILQFTFAEFQSLAVSKNININLENTINKALFINTDKYKFQTIIKNLISNAIKFTPKNGKIILKSIEHDTTFEVIVADTGRGIKANEVSKVFERYYQVQSPNTISEGGTGIGLAICKEYVQLLGGTIDLTSVWQEGSTFRVILPKTQVAPPVLMPFETMETNALQENILVTTENINPDLPTILLVEDNTDMQNYLQHILTPNFNIHIANHGQEALDYLENHQPHLIISDVMMPIMNGYRFLENCKNHSEWAAIPFIMLTAVSATSEKLKFLRLGIDDYLTKPFADEELIARIDNLLENSTQRKEYQIEISKKNIATEIETGLTKENQLWLEQVENIIKANYQRFDFSIDMLAYDLSLSRSQTHRKIKTLTGLTPKEYTNNIRFEMARQLLTNNPSMTIKAIALNVGFKDEKYFSRIFKKHFGKNPSDYLG